MNVYLIISESYVYIKNNIQKLIDNHENVIKYDLANTPLEDILFDACSVSLFDNIKEIVIDNSDEIFSKSYINEELTKYLENPSQLSKIIFVCKKIDKNNIYYKGRIFQTIHSFLSITYIFIFFEFLNII